MKKLFLLLTLFITAAMADGQVAIIKDKDGYTNVRKQPNAQSEIIYRLNSGKAFWYDLDEKGEWVTVYVPKNDFSFSISEPDYLEGFIHRSRLQPLEKMQPYQGSAVSFKYVIESFSAKDKILDKSTGKHIIAINGRPAWGTDGNLPKTQVKEIQASVEGQNVLIHKAFYQDIYECTNQFKVYKNGDTYLVYQWNSDGAGSYQIVWVFTKDGLIQRLVGSMI